MLWNLWLLCFEVPKYSSVRLVTFVSLNYIICKVYCVPMSNVLSTQRIHPKIMCNCIHSESCKYFERRLNYRNIKSPLKIRCNLHNHLKNNDSNVLTYCCTFCCTSMIYAKQIIQKKTPLKRRIRSKEVTKSIDKKISKEIQCLDLGSKKVKFKPVSAKRLIITGNNCDKEDSNLISENKNSKVQIKSELWEKHERIIRNMKKHKCSHCEKSFADIGARNTHEKRHLNIKYVSLQSS